MADRLGCDGGGIQGLILLVEKHRAALRYDWRARFGIGLDESVPSRIAWDEALDLVRVLRDDPSSRLAASVEGWRFTFSQTDFILMRQYELTQAAAGSKKPIPYPLAPWANNAEVQREQHGNARGQSPELVKERLRLMALGQTA